MGNQIKHYFKTFIWIISFSVNSLTLELWIREQMPGLLNIYYQCCLAVFPVHLTVYNSVLFFERSCEQYFFKRNSYCILPKVGI